MTDREKLEKALALINEVEELMPFDQPWMSADSAARHLNEAIRRMPKPNRFEVRSCTGPRGDFRGYYIWDTMQNALASSYYLTQPRADELCDLLNKGHEANDD